MSLEERLQVLEDIEAIRRLKARYCQLCDDDHNPAALAGLFVADGVWEATVSGRYEGTQEIEGYFAALRASGRIRNSAHNAINPDIEVNGDEATGHWRLIMLYTANRSVNVPGDHTVDHTGNAPSNAKEPPPGFFRIIGWYREHYVRTNAGWRYKSLFCQVEESAPYLTAPEDVMSS